MEVRPGQVSHLPLHGNTGQLPVAVALPSRSYFKETESTGVRYSYRKLRLLTRTYLGTTLSVGPTFGGPTEHTTLDLEIPQRKPRRYAATLPRGTSGSSSRPPNLVAVMCEKYRYCL